MPDDLDLENLIPLGVLVAELGTTVDDLARKLADEIFIDDVGLRCVTRSTARAVIAEHDAKQAAAQERRRRAAERIAALSTDNRAAARAVQELHRRRGDGGLIRPPEENL